MKGINHKLSPILFPASNWQNQDTSQSTAISRSRQGGGIEALISRDMPHYIPPLRLPQLNIKRLTSARCIYFAQFSISTAATNTTTVIQPATATAAVARALDYHYYRWWRRNWRRLSSLPFPKNGWANAPRFFVEPPPATCPNVTLCVRPPSLA